MIRRPFGEVFCKPLIGEVAERSKALDWNSSNISTGVRGFESHPLRHPKVVHEVIERLRRALPVGALLWSTEELKPYECDALTLYRQMPLAVALPADEAQVTAVLR